MFDDKIKAFLDEKRFAVLATVGKDGLPQQTVMWYELQDDTIMMNTAAGRVKSSNLQRDQRVSICVEDGYRYVTIVGRVELDDDQERAQADIARLAYRYHDEEKARSMLPSFESAHRITIRQSIERVVANGF